MATKDVHTFRSLQNYELLEKDQAVTSNAYHWRKNLVELSSKYFTQKTLWKRPTDTTVARPLNIIIHVSGSA